MLKVLNSLLLLVVMVVTAMPGGLVDQDLENREIKSKAEELISHALTFLESEYNLIEIVSYRSQVVAGTKHYFQVNVQSRKCGNQEYSIESTCQIHRCKINMWEKPWENFLNVTEYECQAVSSSNNEQQHQPKTTSRPAALGNKWVRTRSTTTTRRPELLGIIGGDHHRQSMPGAFQRIDLNDSTAQSLLFQVTAKLNTEIKEVVADANYFKTTPLKFYRQVVAGTRYIFVTQLQRSVCGKNSTAVQTLSEATSQCAVDNKTDAYFCRITVFVPLPTAAAASRQSNVTTENNITTTSNNGTVGNTTTSSSNVTVGTPIQYGNNPTIDIVGGNTTNGTSTTSVAATTTTTVVLVSTTTIVSGGVNGTTTAVAAAAANTTTVVDSAASTTTTTPRPSTTSPTTPIKFTITERICF